MILEEEYRVAWCQVINGGWMLMSKRVWHTAGSQVDRGLDSAERGLPVTYVLEGIANLTTIRNQSEKVLLTQNVTISTVWSSQILC
jgi:hypothetical protein